jgi:predicted HAD superfamily Cof-like phosphohydrolase
MKKAYEQLIEFQTKFNQPVATKPTLLTEERKLQRYEYLLEELNELKDAKTIVDQADALEDLLYLTLGTFVEIGVNPEPIHDIVHRANMSKLWPDGKVHTNPETGKVMKPPTFVRPEPLLEAEIERQAKEAGE